MRITFKSGAIMLGCTLAICGLLASAGCGPPGPRALLQGERLIKEGKFEEAQAKLKVATTLIPQNAQAWNHLGMAYQGSKMHMEAAAAYEQALKLNRDLSAAHYNLGNLLLEMGNPAAAHQHLTTFTLMQPRMGEGWHKLGVAQFQLGMKDAKTSLEQALALVPTNADAWNTLGLYYMQQNRPREAMNCYETALKHQTNYGPALLNEAIVLHQYLKNRPLALNKYREYLLKNPAAPDFASVQAIALQLDTELQSAVKVQTNAIGAITVRTNAVDLTAALKNSSTNPLSAAMSGNARRSNAVAAVASQVQDKLALSNKTEIVSPGNAAALSITLSTNKETPKVAVTNILQPMAPPTNSIAAAAANLSAPAASNHTVLHATNAPAIKTAMPQVAGAVASHAETNAVPASQTTNAAPVDLKPIQEVTRLETEPPIKLPGDDTASPSLSSSPAAAEAAKDTAEAPAQASSTNSTASSSLVVSKPPAERRSFLQRANPANWFQKKTRETTSVAPKASSTPAEDAANAPAAAKTEEQPAAIAPVISRYPYRNPPKPAVGNTNAARAAMSLAYKDMKAGKWNQAVDGFKKAVAADPACYEARLRLGIAAYQSSSVPEALLEYENALAIDPAAFDARYNFAVALHKANYYRDAANELEKLQTTAPKDARVQLFLANIYAQQLRVPQQARAHYLKVLELEPQHPEAAAIRYWLAANP